MTGPERKARALAHGNPYMPPRRLAKRAGVHVDLARRLLEAERARRRESA